MTERYKPQNRRSSTAKQRYISLAGTLPVAYGSMETMVVLLLCLEWVILMSEAVSPRLHHFNSANAIQTHGGNFFLAGNNSAMGYPLRMPPALVPYLSKDLHKRRGTPLSRKPRQARINANQPGLVNDLGGEGGAATRASAETTAPEDYDYEVLASPQERLQELQEQLQELQEQRQEASAFPTIDPSTDVAEPGGGFIQPGVYSCGHQGSEMFINFINPMYPAQDIMSGSCNFRVVVSNPSVCQLRVDFVNTELHGPQAGNCAEQFLVVGGDIWPTGFDKICGVNPDQHFYVHLDKEKQAEAEGQATVDLTVTTTINGKLYRFGFWITQVDCSGVERSPIEAPKGCTQYYLGANGVVKSFNFEGVQYLTNHNYRVCLRIERDTCFMTYTADPSHFLIQLLPSDDNPRFKKRRRNNVHGSASSSMRESTSSSRPPAGRGEEDCILDYLLIPNGRANASLSGRSFDRFCGGQLNTETKSTWSTPIYQHVSTPEFTWLQVHTSVRTEELLNALYPVPERRPITQVSFFSLGPIRGPSNSNSNERKERDEEVARMLRETGAGFRVRYAQVMNQCSGISTFNRK